VYSSASASLLSLLDPVHHLGLRLALGAFRSSPVESLYAESGLPSLSRRRALLSLRCYARLHQFSTSKITIPQPLLTKFSSHPRSSHPFPFRMHALLSHSPFSNLTILPFQTHSFPPWLIPSPIICSSITLSSPKSDTPPSISRSHFLEHISTHATCTPVYTDGSKSPHGSGCAVLFPLHHFQFQLPYVSSVLTTELYAILFALQHLFSYPSSSFVIFTDSRNSLSLLQSFSSIHPLVREIQDWLFRLSIRKKSICFCWVPSHVGIVGNERADSLARSAATSGYPHYKSIPASDYFPPFRSFLLDRWQSFWSNLSGNKLRTVKPYITPWSEPYHKNRRWETALTRLRIGHTNLTHSHLMTRSPSTLCPNCHIPFSVSHILLFCPCYAADRAATFPYLSDLPRQPCLHDILTKSQHFSLDRIISFLRRIHILHLI